MQLVKALLHVSVSIVKFLFPTLVFAVFFVAVSLFLCLYLFCLHPQSSDSCKKIAGGGGGGAQIFQGGTNSPQARGKDTCTYLV